MFLVSLFGEPCLLDIQCSAVTMGAICSTTEKNDNDTAGVTESTYVSVTTSSNVCICNKKDHYRFGRCFKKRCKTE